MTNKKKLTDISSLEYRAQWGRTHAASDSVQNSTVINRVARLG